MCEGESRGPRPAGAAGHCRCAPAARCVSARAAHLLDCQALYRLRRPNGRQGRRGPAVGRVTWPGFAAAGRDGRLRLRPAHAPDRGSRFRPAGRAQRLQGARGSAREPDQVRRFGRGLGGGLSPRPEHPPTAARASARRPEPAARLDAGRSNRSAAGQPPSFASVIRLVGAPTGAHHSTYLGRKRLMEIREYLRILRRRAWIPLLLMVATGISTALFTLSSKPTYTATATVLAKSQTGTTGLSFQEVAASNSLMLRVRKDLALS